MGKTLQMISLMLAAPPSQETDDTSLLQVHPSCTLVVCPVSVMSNWHAQIEQHVKEEGILKIGFYQGSSRKNLLPQIQNGDINVLLVSYQTLASEFTKVFGKDKKSDNDQESKPPAKKRTKTESIFDYSFHRIILGEIYNDQYKLFSYFFH
jgi:SNF2 family DNA or RNA helicase